MGLKAPKESDLTQPCLQLLRLRGAFAWRVNCGAVPAEYKGRKRFVRFASINGISDIIGVLPASQDNAPGRFIAIELKRPGGKVRPSQKAFLAEISAAGGLALIISDVGQLADALDAEGY